MTETKKYSYRYPHPAVTTDCVIFGFDGSKLNVLLVERGIEPFKGSWALPGGFMRIDETAEECAARELKEETGLEPSYMEQLSAFSRVNRDPRERVVTIAFFALVRTSNVVGGDDAADARWWNIDKLPSLAFDHADILEHALKVLREKVRVEPISFQLLDEEFTMPELQSIYEAILGVNFDRRNFSKKVLSLGIAEPVLELAAKPTAIHPSQPSIRLRRTKHLAKKGNESIFVDCQPNGTIKPGIKVDYPANDSINVLMEQAKKAAQAKLSSGKIGKSPRLFTFNKKQFDFIRKKKDDGTSMPFDF